MKRILYLDNHATTQVDPRVREAMRPFMEEDFANASSRSHAAGLKAAAAVEKARASAAALVGASASEIVFTSGATEANNTALKGLWEAVRGKASHLITQATEHSSVLASAGYLEKQGVRVTVLPVDAFGRVSPEDVRLAVTDETFLISVMLANNEVGTLQPAAEIGKIAKEKGVFFHADAAQAAGKIPVDVEKMGIDLMSWTAHKMYGPKGVGALYIRQKNPHVRIQPLLHGGEQEGGLRSGTLNVPGIVGFGKASEIAADEMPAEAERVKALRDQLEKGFRRLDFVRLNGHSTHRLPGNLNLSFAGVEAGAVLAEVQDEIALSASSACASASTEPSHVLKAMGVPQEYLYQALRFGLGRFTTQEEILFTLDRMTDIIQRCRQASPFYPPEKKL